MAVNKRRSRRNSKEEEAGQLEQEQPQASTAAASVKPTSTRPKPVVDGGARQAGGDKLRILVATDFHLGYKEEDLVRKDDSFDAFEEVFQIAVEKSVDLVLFAGDIFHDNKPSKRTICKTMEIMRKYNLKQKREVQFQVLNANEDGVFSKRFVGGDRGGSEEMEDPNHLKSGLPTFTIHGNHDDPAGVDHVSALDILSSCNLINYYGKSSIEGEGVGQVNIKPVLLCKGKTKVALYGLGWIKDERLANMFKVPGLVKWHHPKDDGVGKYFRIFSVHQNRVHHNAKKCIKEDSFDHNMDLVIWGHEHESLIAPVQSQGAKGYLISQPGSTVQTSLTEGESKQKHCMLLDIQETKWKTTPIPLRSVRPFIFDNLVIKEALEDDEEENFSFKANMEDRSKEIERVIERRVQELLDCLDHDRDASLKEKLPLLRLRVDYSGYTTINSQRFGQKFVGKVANPNDIILFTKKSADKAKEAEEGDGARGKGGAQQPMATSVEDLNALINDNLKAPLEVLDLQDLNRALHNFVEKDNQKAFHECIEKSIASGGSRRKDAEEDTDMAGNDDMDDDFFLSDEDEKPVVKKKPTRKASTSSATKARPAKKQKQIQPTLLDLDLAQGESKQRQRTTTRSLPLSLTQAGKERGTGSKEKTAPKRSLPLSLTQASKGRKTRKKASTSKAQVEDDSDDSLGKLSLVFS